jgi:hypothetical protein
MPTKCNKCHKETYTAYPEKKDKFICGDCKDNEVKMGRWDEKIDKITDFLDKRVSFN